MIRSYTRAELLADPILSRSMHEDRKRVFIDTYKWDLPHSDGLEIDQFDTQDAVYLAGKDRAGTHFASVRLLETESDHILGSIFPFLCEVDLPRGPHVREITRSIASPRRTTAERRLGRNMVARALIEYGLEHGITTYTAVCDLGYLSRVLAAGWRCDPLGLPRKVNGSMIGAFCIHIEEDTIARMAPGWRTDMPALALSPATFRAAA